VTGGPFEVEPILGELAGTAEAGAVAAEAGAAEAGAAEAGAVGAPSAAASGQPPALGQPGAPGSQGPGGELSRAHRAPAKPSNRVLTFAIVLGTLVAALGGFMLNRASGAASDDSDRAQQLGLLGSAAETSAYQQAETDYSLYLYKEALSAKAAQEMLEAGYDQPGTSNWAALYQAARAQVAAAGTGLAADLRPNLGNGDPDPNFPKDFFAERARYGTYLQAKADGYNDAAGKWSALVNSYTAIVTMVAVALFLFGSAYVLYGRNRLLFSVLGTALVLTGLAWGAGLVATRQPGTPSDAAAMDYANGVVALAQAVTPAGYQAAIDDFSAAIAARPDYAQAYAQRSQAEVGRGSEQLGGGFVSTVAPQWERLSIRDDLAAYRLGDRDTSLVADVGWDYYYQWLMDGGRGRPPAQAVAFDRRAVGLDPQDPVSLMNLGLAQLARGAYRGAEASYLAAATHMLYSCSAPAVLSTCTRPLPSTDGSLQLDWLAGGLQDLMNLGETPAAASSPGLRAALADAQGILTASLADGRVVSDPGPPTAQVELSAVVAPNLIELSAPGDAARLASGPVTVLWFERANSSATWEGIAATACWGGPAGWPWGRCFTKQDGSLVAKTELLSGAQTCYTNLQYKAEVFVDGSLAGSVALTPGAPGDYVATALSPALGSYMNMGLCVPSSWHMQPPSVANVRVWGTSVQLHGPLSTAELHYASADGLEGAYIFRLYPERTAYSGSPQQLQQDLVVPVAQYALGLLEGHSPLPGDLALQGQYRSYSYIWNDTSDMMAGFYTSASTGVRAFVGAGIIAPSGVPPGQANQDQSIASNVVDDYAVAVVIVYGPGQSSFWFGRDSMGFQVATSFSLLGFG